MSKDRWKAIDFVKLVYNGELIWFMSNGLFGEILMEEEAPIHRGKLAMN